MAKLYDDTYKVNNMLIKYHSYIKSLNNKEYN